MTAIQRKAVETYKTAQASLYLLPLRYLMIKNEIIL